jgi:site-specific DNA recombinase
MNAIYARVSTTEQVEGYSLTDQLSSGRSHLLTMKLSNIQEYVDDGYSGEYLERPALDRLRNDLRNKVIEHIVIYDPDRLSRNLTNQLLLADEIEKAGAKLIFVTHDYDASPEGRLFFSIRGAISAFEKAKIRERTMRGKRTKALSGKLVFNDKAFGYNYDEENSMYVINEAEAEIIRLMYNLCTDKHYSLRDIMMELRSMGITNRKNKPFTLSNIHRIISNEMYAGTKWAFKYYGKKTSQYKTKVITRPEEEWIPIQVPAIVTKEIWDTAKQVLANNKFIAKRNTKREYLLRGIVKCGCCNRSMTGVCRVQKGIEYKYYVCNKTMEDWYLKTGKCTNTHISANLFEDAVWKTLCSLARANGDISQYLQKPNSKDDSKEQLERMTRYYEELKKKRTDIMRFFRDNLIDSETAQKELQVVQKEISNAATTLSAIKEKKIKDSTKSLNLTADEILLATTFHDKRDILLKIGCIVYVSKTKNDIEWYLVH